MEERDDEEESGEEETPTMGVRGKDKISVHGGIVENGRLDLANNI